MQSMTVINLNVGDYVDRGFIIRRDWHRITEIHHEPVTGLYSITFASGETVGDLESTDVVKIGDTRDGFRAIDNVPRELVFSYVDDEPEDAPSYARMNDTPFADCGDKFETADHTVQECSRLAGHGGVHASHGFGREVRYAWS